MSRKRPIVVISCDGSAAGLKRDKAAELIRKWRALGTKFERSLVGWRVKQI